MYDIIILFICILISLFTGFCFGFYKCKSDKNSSIIRYYEQDSNYKHQCIQKAYKIIYNNLNDIDKDNDLESALGFLGEYLDN